MTETEMKYLKAVRECGSITKAASALFVSQPALTKTIRKLEAEYHTAILAKQGRGIAFTPEGRLICNSAEKILQMKQEMRMGLRRISEARVQVVIISTLQIIHIQDQNVLTEMMREKQIQLKMILAHQDWMSSESWDLCLFAERSTSETSYVHTLQRISLRCYMDPDHPLAKRESVSLRDLAEIPLLIPVLSSPFRNDLELLFHRQGFAPTIALESDNYEAYAEFLSGSGWVAVTYDCCISGMSDHPLVSIPLTEGETFLPTYLKIKRNPKKKLHKEALQAETWILDFFRFS